MDLTFFLDIFCIGTYQQRYNPCPNLKLFNWIKNSSLSVFQFKLLKRTPPTFYVEKKNYLKKLFGNKQGHQ